MSKINASSILIFSVSESHEEILKTSELFFKTFTAAVPRISNLKISFPEKFTILLQMEIVSHQFGDADPIYDFFVENYKKFLEARVITSEIVVSDKKFKLSH